MKRPLTEQEVESLRLVAGVMLAALRAVAKASSLKQAHMAVQPILEKLDRKVAT